MIKFNKYKCDLSFTAFNIKALPFHRVLGNFCGGTKFLN